MPVGFLHVFNLLGVLLIGLTVRFNLFKSLFPQGYDWKKGWIVLSFPVLFFLVIAQFRLVNAKYLLPITPFLMMSGVLFISWGIQRFRAYLRSLKTAPKAWTFMLVFVSFVMNLALFFYVFQPLALKSLASVTGHLNSNNILVVTQELLVTVLKPDKRLLLEKFTFPARSFSMMEKNFEGIELLQMGEPETTVKTLKTFQPDYILINPKSIKDGDNHPMLRFPPDYYAYLRQHFETVAIITPYDRQAKIDYPSDAEDYLALYQAVRAYGKANKKRSQSPGPVLLLLKKSN